MAGFRDVWFRTNRIEAGEYYLYAKGPIKPNGPEKIDIGITVYGPENVNIRAIKDETVMPMLESGLIQKTENYHCSYTSLAREDTLIGSVVSCFKIISSTDGYGFKAYYNLSSSPITLLVTGVITGGCLGNILILLLTPSLA